VTTPEVGPTNNNLAERAIPFVVVNRHVTTVTTGEAGLHWCERIWTVIATCARHALGPVEDMRPVLWIESVCPGTCTIRPLHHARPAPARVFD
jgi:hypothetical protein